MHSLTHSTLAGGIARRILKSALCSDGLKITPFAGIFLAGLFAVSLSPASGQTYGASAYIKPTDNMRSQTFGESIALDGDRLAVATPRSKTYFFERAASGWRETQIIEPIVSDSEFTLSLSGDTLLLGWQRNGSADASDPLDTSLRFSGAVRVLVRDAPGVYQQVAFLKSPTPVENARFGRSLAVDGDTLAIGENNAVHVYQRSGGTWAFSSTLPLPPGTPGGFGRALDLSGARLIVGAQDEASGFAGVNSNLLDTSKPSSGAAYVYVREGSTWRFEAALKASNPDAGDQFGGLVAISGDIVAVTAPKEASAATGIDGDQSDNSVSRAGATYIFERNPASGSWSQVAYVKRPVSAGGQIFHSLALDGSLLAIGTPYDSSNATTVNGDPTNTAALNSGSVHLYNRTADGWQPGDYLKAPNADRTDQFGISLAVSGTSVAAGANQEAGGSRVINAGLDSNDQRTAGAAYIFTPGGTLEENVVLPELEFLSALTPATAIPVDEGGTRRDISIRRTVSDGALTVHFRLAPSSDVAPTEVELSIRRGATDLTSNNGVYSVVIPDGTATAELYIVVLADPTDQAEGAESILLEFVADDAYTLADEKNITHFTSSPSGSLVTNTADSGTGSLRQALLNANSNPDLTVVTFSDGTGGFTNFSDGTHRTISLSTELLIDEDTTLEGPGKCFLSITGNSDGDLTKESGETRVFRLSSKGGGGFDPEEITIRGLTIRDGIAENPEPGFASTDNEGGLILVDNRETIARIENCTLIGGRAGRDGGAISNDSSSGLTIIDSDIVACHARFNGGALFINNRASIFRCRISGNSTTSKGAGIYVDNGDNTTIRECLISNNTAEGAEAAGGGIFVDSTVTIIADCHIVGNRVISRYNPEAFISGGARGGGINYSTAIEPAPQLLVNTTIANNTVFGDSSASGGGIYVFISPIQNAGGIDSPFRIFGCSIIGNRAEQSGLGLPFDLNSSGGGVHFLAATPGTLLDNCTITENEAEDGAGISILNGQSMTIDLYQSIVSGNIGEDIGGTDANNRPTPRGKVASAGYNLIGAGPFFSDFTAPGDRSGITDPGIDSIRYDGGRFPTYTLAPDSPARDAGDPSPSHEEFMFGATFWIANLLETDQRRNGFARIVGGRTDIGAIELDPATPQAIPSQILSLAESTVTFTSIPGRTYTLEISQDLTYFIRLDKSVTATGNAATLTDPTSVTDGRRYYRVVEIPTP